MEVAVATVAQADVRQRPDAANKLIVALQACDNIEEYLGELIPTLLSWLETNNVKVSHSGLQALTALAQRAGETIHPYLDSIHSALPDRLGDSNEKVREAAQELIQALMESGASTPSQTFAHLGKGFSHKNWRLKHSLLSCFEDTLSRYGVTDFPVAKIIRSIAPLVADPNENVRRAAQEALAEAYRHVGDRVRTEVMKNNDIPKSKLPHLNELFDAVNASGTMLPTAHTSAQTDTSSSSSRRPSQERSKPERSSSATRTRSAATATPSSGQPVGARVSTRLDRNRNLSGGVSEEEFLDALAATSPKEISTERELETSLNQINRALSNINEDWEKRVSMLKLLRSIAIGCTLPDGVILAALKPLGEALSKSLSDLRSGVSKEACITTAQLGERFQNDFAPIVDSLLPTIMRQVVINTKIMADSANLCLRHLIRNVYYNKFLSHLVSFADAKSVTQRRSVGESCKLALESWDVSLIHKNASTLKKYLAQALGDADSVVRSTSRQAFWAWHDLDSAAADALMATLDPQKKKHLMEERSRPSSSLSAGSTRSVTTAKKKKPRKSVGDPLRKSASSDDLYRPAVHGAARPRKPSAPAAPAFSKSGPVRVVGQPSQDIVDPRGMSRPAERRRPTSAESKFGNARRITRDNVRSPSATGGASRIPRTPGAVGVTPGKTPGNARRINTPASRIPKTPMDKSLSQSLTNLNYQGTSRGSSPSPTPSEPAASFSAGLASLLRGDNSADWQTRIKIARGVAELIRQEHDVTSRDLKRLRKFFMERLAEQHVKVLQENLKAFAEFLQFLHDRIPSAVLDEFVAILMLKFGAAMSPQLQTKLLFVLELVRGNFPLSMAVLSLFKMLIDPKHTLNMKVKLAIMEQLALLLDSSNSASSDPAELEEMFNNAASDVRSAFKKILAMTDEPRSLDLRKTATHVLTEIFRINPPLFIRVTDSLPSKMADKARKLLTLNVEGWEAIAEGEVSFNDGYGDDADFENDIGADDDYAADVYEQEQTGSALGNGDYEGADSLNDSVDADVAQEAPRSDGYNPTAYSADAAASQARPELAPSERFLRRRAEHKATFGDASPVRPSLSRMSSTTSMDSTTDRHHSIESALDQLEDATRDTTDTEKTLQWMLRRARDEGIETWRDNFDSIQQTVIALSSDYESSVRELALRVLREMLKNLPDLFSKSYHVVVPALLRRYEDTEREVLRATDEVITIVGETVEPSLGLQVLAPIVNADASGSSTVSQPELVAALKLLTQIIKRSTPQALQAHIEEVMPGLVKAYKHEAAEVRKAVVFALVEATLTIGEDALAPHLKALSQSQIKLLNIYISRAQASA